MDLKLCSGCAWEEFFFFFLMVERDRIDEFMRCGGGKIEVAC